MPPTLSIPEIRDFHKINAELVSLLDAGHSHIRLEGAEGHRLLASGLGGHWNAVIEILGRTGPELAAGLDSPGVVVLARGDTADGAGTGMHNGRVIVIGDAGDAAGYAQSGGTLVITGSTGHRAGLRQSGGTLATLGPAGRLCADRQSGGYLFIRRGQLGQHSGRGKTGGQLVAIDNPQSLEFGSSQAWNDVVEFIAPWTESTILLPT